MSTTLTDGSCYPETSEVDGYMESWTLGERWRRGIFWAAGMGWLAGALELVSFIAGTRLPLGPTEILTLGVVNAALMGLLTAALAAVTGLVHVQRPDAPSHRNLAIQEAVAAGVLAMLLLEPFASWLHEEGRTLAAVAIMAMPLGMAGTVLFHTRYWLARAELGRPAPVGWMLLAAAGTGVLLLGSAAAHASRDTGGSYALEGDPNILLVTVDGWRRSDTSLYGGAETPRLEALAARGAVFERAISSSPTTSVGVHGSVMSGLHPLRHRGIGERYVIPRGVDTLAERFRDEGWATAAFVSTVAVGGHSGLEQGFLVFDEGFGESLPGSAHLRLTAVLGGWLGDGPVSRAGADTVRAFEGWLIAHRSVPWMAWVHLADPMRGEAGAVDALIGAVVDAVDASGTTERTLVLLSGGLGADEGHVLDEVRLRVPLVVVAPGRPRVMSRVEPQIRLLDLPQTALRYADLDPLGEAEGVELLSYLSGDRKASLWASVLARDVDDSWWMGVRTDDVKYVVEVGTEDERLYDLVEDPEAQDDISSGQPAATASAGQSLQGERAALRRRLAEGTAVDEGIEQRLRSLGYH